MNYAILDKFLLNTQEITNYKDGIMGVKCFLETRFIAFKQNYIP